MKGFIEVTVIAAGLDALTVKQLISVDEIQVILDCSELAPSDREALALSQRAGCVIIASGVSEIPCDVAETYEEVKQRIAEAV